jgi:hypothetical protein
LFEDESDTLIPAFRRIPIFPQEAFDQPAHLGSDAVAHLPVHRGAIAQLLGQFGRQFLERLVTHRLQDFRALSQRIMEGDLIRT